MDAYHIKPMESSINVASSKLTYSRKKIHLKNQKLEKYFILQKQFHLIEQNHKKYLYVKRAIDLLASTIIIPLLILPFIFVAILIKINSKGSVFFYQKRVGVNCSVFKIWKFRTMTEKTDLSLPKCLTKPLEKDQNDYRVTKVGKYLRKYKIDEFPQIINVFLGNMSLVGPRPFPLYESIYCPKRHINRFSIKPGMTGIWQAHRENTIYYKLKFKYDSYYAKKISFLTDLYLIKRTFFRVLKGEKQHVKPKSPNKDNTINQSISKIS